MTTLLRSWFAAILIGTLFISGCASPERRTGDSNLILAETNLKHARAKHRTIKTRAGYYLEAAALAEAIIEGPKSTAIEKQLATSIYNSASGEVTALLRDGSNLWREGADIPAPNGKGIYKLNFQRPKPNQGIWSPNYFTDFELSSKVSRKGIRKDFRTAGIGGTLVGVRKTGEERTAKDPFANKVGTSAPVTATLDFAKPTNGFRMVTLTLSDPTKREKAPIPGISKELAADYTAPFAWYPRQSEFWAGLESMLKVEAYLGSTGLYMLQPYDPSRIPVIFIHGLASTPQMWINTINEIDGDPALRNRFQYWVFRYPTGIPMAYSSLQLRESLALAQKLYGLPKGVILIGHSMGGLLAQMQSTTSGRVIWNAVLRKRADEFYKKLPANNVIKQTMIFNANPKVDRIIFICTPHRGSEMAVSRIGNLATRLISLPITLIDGLQSALGASIDILTGEHGQARLTSIQSLSPKNPVLLSMDELPIQAPYNSIIGDRGKGNTPNSSDGVVPYWSSHMKGAESELIVPGPHGSYELPQTINELRRILTLQLKEGPRKRIQKTNRKAPLALIGEPE